MSESNLINLINPDHVGLLKASLRSPSAHNAQPWKIRPLKDKNTYELHYDHNDYLPDDPDDRDAYLTMGAFVETMVLEAPNFNLKVNVEAKLKRDGEDMFIAQVELSKLDPNEPIEPLSKFISERATNRNHYSKEPISQKLEQELRALGNTLFEPTLLKDVLTEASMKSWANPRFVRDLHIWYRDNLTDPDGFNAPQMNLNYIDKKGLKFAFWRKQFKSKLLERLYSTRDVAMFTAAPKAAVLAADDMSPAALFDAGRRLLRSWVTVQANGYHYHPFSIAIDEKSTAPKVAKLTGVSVPVALYRIGKTDKKAWGSNRKDLSSVIIE